MNSKELDANIRKTIDTWFETEKDVEDTYYNFTDRIVSLTLHQQEGWFEDEQLFLDP